MTNSAETPTLVTGPNQPFHFCPAPPKTTSTGNLDNPEVQPARPPGKYMIALAGDFGGAKVILERELKRHRTGEDNLSVWGALGHHPVFTGPDAVEFPVGAGVSDDRFRFRVETAPIPGAMVGGHISTSHRPDGQPTKITAIVQDAAA